MNKNRALIIDDEPDICELLEITLSRMKIDCLAAENLAVAKQLLQENHFDICLTDMRLPDGDGVEFVSYLQENYPDIPVAVITAHGNMETAIRALKSGAFDFLTKPVDLTELRKLIDSAFQIPSENLDLDSITLIGNSKIINELNKKIAKLARSQAPIYISGESGVGKELAARMIHGQGPRSSNAFVPVNCGAIPTELMEAEFFGYKKGSFTGAYTDKVGFFQAAEGGTLFLDEVAELPLSMQVKLLRVIQEKKVRAIGDQEEISVDVRVLSATHKNLASLVETGRFRHDLFYRINVIELFIQPLRDRPEDIPLLTEYILQKFSAVSGERELSVSRQAMEELAKYNFPGNIRELENILERAMTLCSSSIIEFEDLQLPNSKAVNIGSEKPEMDHKLELNSYLVDIERETILKALEQTRWNKTAAAKILGISFRALRYKLEKLDIK